MLMRRHFQKSEYGGAVKTLSYRCSPATASDYTIFERHVVWNPSDVYLIFRSFFVLFFLAVYRYVKVRQ